MRWGGRREREPVTSMQLGMSSGFGEMKGSTTHGRPHGGRFAGHSFAAVNDFPEGGGVKAPKVW